MIMPKKRFDRSGFTIIEMVMVIVLIGILSITVAPRLTNTVNINLSLAANVIVSDIINTQQDAMSTHQSLGITFSSGSATYTYGKDSLTRDLTELNSALTISVGTTIRFNSIGEPKNSSDVGFAMVQTITVSDGSNTKSLTIQPYTGKTNIL